MANTHKHETLKEGHHEVFFSMSPVNKQRSEDHKDSEGSETLNIPQSLFRCEHCDEVFTEGFMLENHI